MPHQSVTSLVQVFLCFLLHLVLSIFSFIGTCCFPFPRIKCPKYCSFLSCIVLRSVCFAFAISKTSTLVFRSRCDILNMRRKIHISKALILSSICLLALGLAHLPLCSHLVFHCVERFWRYNTALPYTLLIVKNSEY